MGYPPLHLLPAGATPRPAPDDLHIREVRDRTALHDWERVAIDGFPLEEVADAPPGTAVNDAWLDDPRRRLWVGYVDGRPVAASSAWVEVGINNVTLVATLPDARRHGYGEALTWSATLADPTLPAMLFSSDEGRPVYERMGYLPLLRMTLWYRPRPG
jgi:GNAT superfamily N-acetyltransferase